MISSPDLSVNNKNKSSETAEVVRAPRKKWWLAGLSIICWQVAALLLVESVLFAAGIGEEEIFKFDSKLGFRHFPNKLVTWRSEGYARSYFGADGLRESNVTVTKPANTYRVVLLGDSLVESLQVPLEKTFGRLIQKTIGPVDGKRVEVVNFANSGYSTAQECLVLEDRVLQYHPDLVVLGYSSRDLMENWSPPDETVSNVRPVALKLPGRPLLIDSSPVVTWLKSPRARFLQSIEWFRQNSRVWGIISATELQLSMKDPVVKAFLGFATNPVRCVRGLIKSGREALALVVHQKPAKPQLAVGSTTPAAAPAPAPATKPASIPVPAPVAAKVVAPFVAKTAVAPVASAVIDDPAERNSYTRLISATMGGLIERMHADCVQNNARFLVLGLPSRVDLAPYPGVPPTSDLSYEDEMVIVRKLCAKDSVPFVDVNSPARALNLPERKALFFSAHLAPPGHVYLSKQLVPVVRQYLTSASASVAGVSE
jgi:hypothetical protein